MDLKINELERLIEAEYSNTTGVVVLKNGETVYEGYFNGYDAEDAFHVFSVTKSILSMLLGVAVDRKYIDSIDRKVLDFFPDYIPKRGEKTAQLVTIRDMLTMTAPFKYRSAPYTKYFSSDNWVRSALDLLGGKGDIGSFRYLPLIGPDILSGILTQATGKSALEFAKENLFGPLDIDISQNVVFSSKDEQLDIMKNRHESGWVADPQGINTAGWGLFLTPRNMAKLGQLYLHRGAWKGKQLVSEMWVGESTSEQSRWEELGLSYGYLWWPIDETDKSFAAMGDGGNVIYIDPARNIVAAMAGMFKPRAKDRIGLIREIIEPMFG